MKTSDVVDLVYDGKLDSVIDDLWDAIVARKKVLRTKMERQNLRRATPGTRVKLVSIRPKYMAGVTGEVIEPPFGTRTKPGYLWIDIGTPIRRYGPKLSVPASSIKIVVGR